MKEEETFKVSVIVPVYNVEGYLAECLESILNQTYKNTEIILINDGSTDGSRNLILNFMKNHDQIILIETENNGLSCARNVGLDKASGDYIVFVDSDDWIEKDAIEKCMAEAKSKNVEIVFFNANAFADGVSEFEVERISYDRPKELENRKTSACLLFEKFIESDEYIVSACLYIYKAKLYKEEKFFPGIYHEDNLFTTKLLIKYPDAAAICLPDRFYHRRVRPNSIMTKIKNDKHVDGYFKVAEELIKEMVSNKNKAIDMPLNRFIQSVICTGIVTAYSASKENFEIRAKMRGLKLLFKTRIRYLKFKVAVVCIFPAILKIKNNIKRFYMLLNGVERL
ncbi:glycosyltransferase [Limnobacter profundi]|uniref:Glycosyltransferase n=1 Tax=Limnobacter profundi TaxID=2732163 RepID=A0ABX6N8I9_9BURK|nr:glycosyltransferase [Limnobacter sp. SAORIC-580]QJR30733.1 glycosyltransferase [Limnobacter sp. SAORIC-580]